MTGSSLESGGRPGSARDDAAYWHRVVPAIGVLFLLAAAVKAAHTATRGADLVQAAMDLLLIGSVGVVLLSVGVWLPTSEVRPESYPRIATWVVGGVAVMGLVLGLRVVHPGVTVEFAFGTQAVFLAIGSIAGLGIGVHEARALATADRLEEVVGELEATNDELESTNDELEATNLELEATNEELEDANDQLEDANDRLEDANDQLEASNEQLEQFAHAASHDLREPLRMVRSYLELLDGRYGDDLEEDAEEFLAFAVDGAERMDDMIDGLLAYSRVETQGEQFEAVDLDAVLDDVLADLQLQIEESGCEIERESLPTVHGDGRQLRQVFQNLLTNAMQYCGEDDPDVEVTAERTGETWTVAVRDHGVGMTAEDADRVFDVFERLHSIEEQDGSGIGLALSERVVERHGGEIWVESEAGEGATFSFTLQPADAAEEDVTAAAPRATSDAPTTGSRSR